MSMIWVLLTAFGIAAWLAVVVLFVALCRVAAGPEEVVPGPAKVIEFPAASSRRAAAAAAARAVAPA
jgi:hypothetical protein